MPKYFDKNDDSITVHEIHGPCDSALFMAGASDIELDPPPQRTLNTLITDIVHIDILQIDVKGIGS